MRTLAILFLAAVSVPAQVRFSSKDEVAIKVDGKPFTTFYYGNDAAKPYLWPLRSASGKVVTRAFPEQIIPGESRDHLHHRGLWFSYDDVNGVKFWENDPSYTNKNPKGTIVVKSTDFREGDRSGTLHAVMEWRDPAGKVLLTENRETIFYADPKLRTMDFVITLTAAQDVTFGDTKEGAFAIRLAEEFTEKKGAKIVDANGRAGMKNVWGKRSNWVDYSAEIGGERIGVAIFDHPSNPHAPTYWHARDYGLFSLNPFGQNSFDQSAAENKTKLAKGQQMTFKWRVVIHPGDSDVAALYQEFAK